MGEGLFWEKPPEKNLSSQKSRRVFVPACRHFGVSKERQHGPKKHTKDNTRLFVHRATATRVGLSSFTRLAGSISAKSPLLPAFM